MLWCYLGEILESAFGLSMHILCAWLWKETRVAVENLRRPEEKIQRPQSNPGTFLLWVICTYHSSTVWINIISTLSHGHKFKNVLAIRLVLLFYEDYITVPCHRAVSRFQLNSISLTLCSWRAGNAAELFRSLTRSVERNRTRFRCSFALTASLASKQHQQLH